MTKEEAIEDLTVLRERIDPEQWEAYIRDIDPEALDMAIKALEQECVLGKIRAEIAELQKDYQGWGWAYDDALEIIDKYIEADKEAAAEDAQDTIPVQSGAEHDMQ